MKPSEVSLAIGALISSYAKNLTDKELLILICALSYSIDTLKIILELRRHCK